MRIRPGPLPTAASREIGGCHLPRGGGKGVVRNGLRLSKSGVQPLRHRLAGDRRRHLPLHRGGFIVSPVSGASAAAWKRAEIAARDCCAGVGLVIQ